MAVFSVEGKLGTGKTKFCVWRAQTALLEGRRVASNVDLHLSHLIGRRPGQYVRLPDKPTEFDLDAAGHGNPASYDEDRNGVMILDELGTWLNSRSFQDKSRAGLIDWLIHARKKGWDVFLIVQNSQMIDRQVREALIEYRANCVRLDKVRIPVVSVVLRMVADVVGIVTPASWGRALGLSRWGYLPRMHLVAARVGEGQNAIVAERWFYRGDDLHAAYDTRQVFRADYPHGSFTVMHRPEVPPTLSERLAAWWRGPARPALKPKPAELARLAASDRDRAWQLARERAAA